MNKKLLIIITSLLTISPAILMNACFALGDERTSFLNPVSYWYLLNCWRAWEIGEKHCLALLGCRGFTFRIMWRPSLALDFFTGGSACAELAVALRGGNLLLMPFPFMGTVFLKRKFLQLWQMKFPVKDLANTSARHSELPRELSDHLL